MRLLLAGVLLLGAPWIARAEAPPAQPDSAKGAAPRSPQAQGAADAGPKPQRPFEWEVPGMVAHVEVAGIMEAQGIPMKLHAVTSSWKPPELFDHFVKVFEEQGFYLPPPEHQVVVHGALSLTAMDVDRMLVYTVFLRINPDGKTTKVLLGTSNMGLAKNPQAVAFVPLFPGARNVITSNVEVGRSVRYLASTTPRDLADFYRKAMTEAGYTESRPGVYFKGREQIEVLARPLADGTLSVFVVGRMGVEDELTRTRAE